MAEEEGFAEKNRRGKSTSDEEGRSVRASAAEIEERGAKQGVTRRGGDEVR